jgi:hypothetical protein
MASFNPRLATNAETPKMIAVTAVATPVAFVYRGGNAQGVRGNRMGTPGHVQEAKQGFAHASAACRLVRTAGAQLPAPPFAL